jgi:hypothetical protein
LADRFATVPGECRSRNAMCSSSHTMVVMDLIARADAR